MTQDATTTTFGNGNPSLAIVQHPVYWFEDGSVIFSVEQVAFKVHGTMLSRLSSFFAQSKAGTSKASNYPYKTIGTGTDVHIVVDSSRRVLVKDVEILLEHLYHDIPISSDSSLSRIMSVLRVSSPVQLDFPAFHVLAKDQLHSMFHSNGSVPVLRPDNLEEALLLANEYRITPMQKALYYSLVTSPESKADMETAQTPNDNSVSATTPPSGPIVDISPKPEVVDPSRSNPDAHQTILSQSDADICTRLMTHLIDHFTPILFTPPATSHMACTDVFADTWMSLVIQPAIENDGVYKPLETLELMKGIDWEKEGLCPSCVKEKHEEWTDEQMNVWKAMDAWLGLN